MNAPPRLVRHAELVEEAAELLIPGLSDLGLVFNADLVLLGAVLHDAGKCQHPEELASPGTLHEAAGQALLLEQGVQPEVARICVSLAKWAETPCSLEELLVALVDKLWKGKRDVDLETRVIDEISGRLERDRWDLFAVLDSLFEFVAHSAPDRLERSRDV